MNRGCKDGDDGDEEAKGRKKVAQLIKEENAAIEDFFMGRRPKAGKAGTKGGKKKKKEDSDPALMLSVPLNEPTPAVKELEDRGAGYSYNPVTKETKKVTRGKRATRGRGTVSMPNNLNDIGLDNFDYGEEDDHEDGQSGQSIVGGGEKNKDDEDEDNPLLRMEDQSAEMVHETDESIQRDTPYFSMEDGLPVSHPVYDNELWSEASMRKLPKPKKTTHRYYTRRSTAPAEFYLPSINDSKTGKGVTGGQGATGGQGVKGELTACKLLTFHSDGKFYWPSSSPHLCWNCCQKFEGPPAMIPRQYNRSLQCYHVYGNFCSWPCAKRYSVTGLNGTDNFFNESGPTVDYFCWKYFNVKMPLPIAPPPILLECFSEFGMTIDEYRGLSKIEERVSNYTMVHPPFIPYEVLVTWQKKHPTQSKIKKGYDQAKKRRFEEQMAGIIPLPKIPDAISASDPKLPPSLSSASVANGVGRNSPFGGNGRNSDPNSGSGGQRARKKRKNDLLSRLIE